MHEKLLLEQCDVISLLKSLKYAAKYTFDVDGLAKVYLFNLYDYSHS